jgi:hypothetical protein
MCRFFSFVTEPDGHPNERFYFDWEQRQKDFDGADSHDHIIGYYKLRDSMCNSYEYNPLTGDFEIDQQNGQIDDRVRAEMWVRGVDFKKIVEPLIIKPIVNTLELPKVRRVTKQHKQWLKEWDSVWASVRASVWASVWASVGASVRASVGDSVGASVRDLVGDSVGGYTSSFFDIPYEYNFFPCINLWESALIPSFDGVSWRLHSGKKADVVYEVGKDELKRL